MVMHMVYVEPCGATMSTRIWRLASTVSLVTVLAQSAPSVQPTTSPATTLAAENWIVVITPE